MQAYMYTVVVCAPVIFISSVSLKENMISLVNIFIFLAVCNFCFEVQYFT